MTLREAQEALDALACSVQTRKQLQAHLDAKKHPLLETMREGHDQAIKRHDDEIGEIRKGLKALAKQLDDLAVEGDAGDISAVEYGERYDALNAERKRFLTKAESIKAQMAKLEQFEADPDAALEDFQQRHPSTRIEVPWRSQ